MSNKHLKVSASTIFGRKATVEVATTDEGMVSVTAPPPGSFLLEPGEQLTEFHVALNVAGEGRQARPTREMIADAIWAAAAYFAVLDLLLVAERVALAGRRRSGCRAAEALPQDMPPARRSGGGRYPRFRVRRPLARGGGR